MLNFILLVRKQKPSSLYVSQQASGCITTYPLFPRALITGYMSVNMGGARTCPPHPTFSGQGRQQVQESRAREHRTKNGGAQGRPLKTRPRVSQRPEGCIVPWVKCREEDGPGVLGLRQGQEKPPRLERQTLDMEV